jgi:phosphoglycolate phosphatase/AHBA synthesis associated protein
VSAEAGQGLRAILFDLDGVLIDSYQVWFHVMNGVAAALGYPEVSAEQFHASWGQGIEADVEKFFPRHGIPAIERCYDAEYPRHLARLEVAADAAPLLAALHERGLRTAVVTNTPSPLTRRILAHAALEPDDVVGGTDVPHPKPAPDMVLLACERLGLATGEVLFVGDSRYDREAAAAAGVRFVGLGIDGDLRIDALAELDEVAFGS